MDELSVKISEQIERARGDRFTGKMTIVINMNGGGIGQVSLNKEQNLKNFIAPKKNF